MLGVPPAPMSARGPTIRFRGFVKAPGNGAADRVEQSSTTPRGRSLTVTPDIAGLAAGVPVSRDAPADSVRTLAARIATAPAAIAVLAISVQRRAFIPLFVHPAPRAADEMYLRAAACAGTAATAAVATTATRSTMRATPGPSVRRIERSRATLGLAERPRASPSRCVFACRAGGERRKCEGHDPSRAYESQGSPRGRPIHAAAARAPRRRRRSPGGAPSDVGSGSTKTLRRGHHQRSSLGTEMTSVRSSITRARSPRGPTGGGFDSAPAGGTMIDAVGAVSVPSTEPGSGSAAAIRPGAPSNGSFWAPRAPSLRYHVPFLNLGSARNSRPQPPQRKLLSDDHNRQCHRTPVAGRSAQAPRSLDSSSAADPEPHNRETQSRNESQTRVVRNMQSPSQRVSQWIR
jgi:hypothetical protein